MAPGYWICANGVAHSGACNCVTRPPAVIEGAVVDVTPNVVDGEVVRVIEIQPYPNALTPLGGCTNFRCVAVDYSRCRSRQTPTRGAR